MTVLLRGRVARGCVGGLFLALVLLPQMVHAQALERNLPPAPQSSDAAIVAPNATPSSQDTTPLGPSLAGIIVLGPEDAVRIESVTGVSTALVHRLDTAKARRALAPFIGKPMSRKLIAQVEAAIARYYRRHGFPFVSLSTPPQTIGGGLLQIRVVEFHNGETSVTGVQGKRARYIRGRLRLQPGQPIDAPQLSDDLDWLNRYPFRDAEAVFSPGDALGRTDLEVRVKTTKPWQVYAGYSNSGSRTTTWDRYFLGGEVGGLVIPDSLVSYQFTGSPNAFGAPHPAYISNGLRASAPVAPRQDIEASFDHVETNVASVPFQIRQTTDELSIGYRTALSNFSGLRGDAVVGIEAKQQDRKTYFSGVQALDNLMDVFQLYGGWSNHWSDIGSRSSINVVVHASPGGFDSRNSDAALYSFSNGRVSRGQYQYVNAQFSRYTRLAADWGLSNMVIAQYASGALPSTEQMGVGGADLVRGYTLDDGAYDSAIVVRNVLYAPSFPVLGRWQGAEDRLTPHAFLDAGYGSQRGISATAQPIATGIGADYQIRDNLHLTFDSAYAIREAASTRSGDFRVQGRLSLTY